MTEKEVEELYKIAKNTMKLYHIPFDEDLMQEMVMYAANKINLYTEEKGSKTTFLTLLMKQCYIMHERAKKRLKAIPDWAYVSADKQINENEDTLFIDTFCDEKNKENLMEDFMKVIKPLIGKELELKLQGLSIKEITQILGCTRINVHKKISDNITRIRQYLIRTKQYDYYKELVDF